MVAKPLYPLYKNIIKPLDRVRYPELRYSMFVDERKKVCERNKEYDVCYLVHYAQWFFWFFFTLGFGSFIVAVVCWLGSYYGWFK